MPDDTIAAISTPVGEGGVGIVRLSGPEALQILNSIFTRRRGGNSIVPWHVYHGHIVDPDSGEAIDEVLGVYMAAPKTYTREDVVEISCHGGLIPLQSILSLVLRQGARLAHPGEFTLRAFLNGRIDLAQAESVLDIIKARTRVGLHIAMHQLGGRLSQEIREVRGSIISVLAYLTATIDFAEDEIPEEDFAAPLRESIARVRGLLDSADAGIIYRQGLRTAIVGKPNVGKSSLLNALLRHNRAIVTPIPGTTRDTLEEAMSLGGIPLVLVDTAGITETGDVVERLGVERSRQAIQQADLALLVLDGSSALEENDREIAGLIWDRPAIVVINKSDLPQRIDVEETKRILGDRPLVRASTVSGDGLADVEEMIVGAVLRGKAAASDSLLVSNPRHKEALGRALSHLESAEASVQRGLPADFIAIDLSSAADALGEITGETVTEDLLETIFSKFCIGK
ncbi:MAG: tRNA uridine-5-carboxymethylaminomethyl(34) synthesis GTPase MnmE [Chloroflexi bacterium]|nr:tRNA uridine-5-carboxymethylaminomethyl(34) synthesis GTPase MnmE [Chloroflexota bacterium]MDA8187991.1 tRNA uridine-5-carboxymethylaminomethyl(34) synthesis GTPase MnmE [Dehalococcoidales bacterium]